MIGEVGANIQQIYHDRGHIGIGPLETLVTVELESRGRDDMPRIVERLRAAGYRIVTGR